VVSARWRSVVLAPFDSVDRSALRWLRTSERPIGFDLAAGNARVAELRWARHEGSLASAEGASQHWTLKRGGFLNPHVTARADDGGTPVARLSAHLSAHRIEVRGARAYRFHRAGLLVPAWIVSTEDGGEILHIEPVREGRKLEGGAVLASELGRQSPELLLLTVMSWYFIVLAWFEDEALLPLEGS
jgi:hypothetical protein